MTLSQGYASFPHRSLSSSQHTSLPGSFTSTTKGHDNILASWEKAIELFNSQLTKDEKKKIKLAEYPRARFSDLLSAANDAKKKVEQLKHPWTGTLQKVLGQINRYAVVGDIIVQHHAEYTSLVWGTFRFLLLFAVEEQKTSEKLLKALDSISQIIFRGEEYAKLFSTPSDTSTDRVFQSLQDNLTHLYAEVLNFLVRATTFFKKETIRRYISAGLSSDIKFQPILNQINKYELNVEKDKNLLESEARKRQQQYENGVWLRHADFETDLQKLQEAHLPNTCEWFLQGEAYKKWQELSPALPTVSFLWVRGGPGSGKSVLASQVVRNVSLLNGAVTIYVFCKTGQENKNTLESLLRNLVFQLLVKSNQSQFLHELVFNARFGEKSSGAQSMDVLWNLLERMLQVNDNLFCILDGLDECDNQKSDRDAFIARLTETFVKHCSQARIIAFSQLELTKSDDNQMGWEFIQIKSSNLLDDIKRLTSSMMENSKRLKTHPQKPELLEKVVIDSNGMILWAKLMIQELEEGHWAVEEVLKKSPRGLFTMYDAIMNRYARQDNTIKVHLILKHVIAAARPLHIEELALSIAVAEGLRHHEEYDQRGNAAEDGRDLIHNCSPLLLIMPDDTVQVMHASLKDYLLGLNAQSNQASLPFSESDIHGHMAFILIKYMSFDCFNAELEKQIQPTNYLIEYASKWLIHHCVKTTCSTSLQGQLTHFFEISQGWRWLERLFENYHFSFGHLQVWQTQMKEWALSSGLAGEASSVFGDFLLILCENRYKEHHLLPEDNLYKLDSMSYLAIIYSKKGWWKEAEELEVQVIKSSKQVFGEEHPKTLISIYNLVSTYIDQGRWKEAEMLQIREMKISKKVLREENLNTLNSMHNLALIYVNQGRWREAEMLQRQVMKISKKALGEEHPATLAFMCNFASIYSSQGRWKKAEMLDFQAMKISKKVLGEEHPNTLNSMHSLAFIYMNQGRWKEAGELGIQTLNARKRVLGEEHPDTLRSTNNLGFVYSHQGRWKEGQILQIQAVKTSEKILGKEHSDTLIFMSNLASTYSYQGQWKKAELLEMQVMKTRGKTFGGKEHPDMLASMNNLALIYKYQNRNEKAIELMKKVVEVGKKVMGTNHPNIIHCMENLELWEEESKGESKEENGKNSEGIEDELGEEWEEDESDGEKDSKQEEQADSDEEWETESDSD